MIGYPSYAIVAVSYDDHGGIKSIKRHRLDVDTVDGFEDVSKESVIEDIEAGKKHFTLNLDRKEVDAEMVHVVNLGGKKFVQTDNNDSENDNLGGLPEY